VAHNPVLRDPAGLAAIWLRPPGADYFPLTATAQWLQWRLWGGDPLGYHCVNVACHVLGAWLLWRILRRLGIEAAWLGGLLFVLHPLAVESVAWISELKNVLSFPLLLLAFGAYLEFDDGGRRRDLVRSNLWFLAAMLAKTSVAMFPGFLLVHAWWRRGRVGRTDLLAATGFGAVSLVLGVVTIHFQIQRALGSDGTAFFSSGHPTAGLTQAIFSFWFYFKRCLWPARLMPIYPSDLLGSEPLRAWTAAGVSAAVLGVLWFRRAAWGRHVILGIGWFLLNLLPVLGVVPMAFLRIAPVADHLAYVSLAGIAGLAAAAASPWSGRETASRSAKRARTLRWAGVAAAAALAVETHRYAAVFQSEETLWTYAVDHNPAAWMAQFNLGNVLLAKSDWPGAISRYEAALAERPAYAEAENNLGIALSREGRVSDALPHFQRALRLRPDYPEAGSNLGLALATTGRLEDAILRYEEVLRLHPDYLRARDNLALALRAAGRNQEAQTLLDSSPPEK